MLPHDELLHYGVLGMRWGVRKSQDQINMERAAKAANKANKANIKAEIAKLKIFNYDRNQQLNKAGLSIDKNDKDAVKRFKLQKKALKAEIKARKMSIKAMRRTLNTTTSQAFRTTDRPNYQANRAPFNDKYKNPEFAQRVSSKPISATYKRDSVFKKAMSEAVVKSTGTAASKLIAPTANMYGEELMRYIISQRR